jgi:hypothetical protein
MGMRWVGMRWVGDEVDGDEVGGDEVDGDEVGGDEVDGDEVGVPRYNSKVWNILMKFVDKSRDYNLYLQRTFNWMKLKYLSIMKNETFR